MRTFYARSVVISNGKVVGGTVGQIGNERAGIISDLDLLGINSARGSGVQAITGDVG